MNQAEQPHVCRRGWLKNNNPAGDLSKVIKCGAQAKQTNKACRAPAMSNGSLSISWREKHRTKDRSRESRSRMANWKTGKYSNARLAEGRSFSLFLKECKSLYKQLKS